MRSRSERRDQNDECTTKIVLQKVRRLLWAPKNSRPTKEEVLLARPRKKAKKSKDKKKNKRFSLQKKKKKRCTVLISKSAAKKRSQKSSAFLVRICPLSTYFFFFFCSPFPFSPCVCVYTQRERGYRAYRCTVSMGQKKPTILEGPRGRWSGSPPGRNGSCRQTFDFFFSFSFFSLFFSLFTWMASRVTLTQMSALFSLLFTDFSGSLSLMSAPVL